jgi:putative membrane protein
MSDLNDPRVFFAAERTLLAWTRTVIALMAFGFVIERFGLFVHILMPREGALLERDVSFWAGVAFILLGAIVAILSAIQYVKVLRTFKPVEVPEGYWVNVGVFTNLILAAFGVAITLYFFRGLP